MELIYQKRNKQKKKQLHYIYYDMVLNTQWFKEAKVPQLKMIYNGNLLQTCAERFHNVPLANDYFKIN